MIRWTYMRIFSVVVFAFVLLLSGLVDPVPARGRREITTALASVIAGTAGIITAITGTIRFGVSSIMVIPFGSTTKNRMIMLSVIVP